MTGQMSNDAFIQVVSVFAIGYTFHFDTRSGGDASITNSNSNVINIDGRTSIQNAPDEAMQGIISILFDKIPELKKLGPAALNFKR